MADVAASATIATTTSTTPTLHGATAEGDRAVHFGATPEEEWSIPVFREIPWECHNRGGWKATNAAINEFLEEQYVSGVPSTWRYVDPGQDMCHKAKYEWNFADLVQFRMHKIDGEWHTVKRRSIRRIRVLCAPEKPRG